MKSTEGPSEAMTPAPADDEYGDEQRQQYDQQELRNEDRQPRKEEEQ